MSLYYLWSHALVKGKFYEFSKILEKKLNKMNEVSVTTKFILIT